MPRLPARAPAAERHARSLLPLQAELDYYMKDYVGRPSPLYHAERISEYYRR